MVSSSPSTPPFPAAASWAGDAVDTLPPGQILIQYAARADWHGISNPSPTAQGQARLLYLDTAGEIFTTRVWVDPTRHPRGDTLDNGLGVPPGQAALRPLIASRRSER